MWGGRPSSRSSPKRAARRPASSATSRYVQASSPNSNAVASLSARPRRMSATVVIACSPHEGGQGRARASCLVQREAWPRPRRLDQPPGTGEGDDRSPPVAAAERDVRGHVARDREDVGLLAVGRDDDDPVTDRAYGDPAVVLDGERVEGERRRGHAPAAVAHGDRPRRGAYLARRVEVPRPEPAGEGLGHVDAPPVGREPHAVRPEERERDLPHRAAGRYVIERAPVDALAAALPVVGEP